MRIDTDSTLDESVEMQMWVWDRSRFMRIARWRNTAVCALIAGVAVTVYIPEPWSVKIAFGGTTAAITGFVYYALYPWELRRRLRKVCRKLRGTVGPVPFTLELDAEGIHCQYKDTRNSSAWSKVEVIEDRGGTVIFWMRDYGITVVRKRAFSSPAEQEEFLALAHRYHRKAPGSLNHSSFSD